MILRGHDFQRIVGLDGIHCAQCNASITADFSKWIFGRWSQDNPEEREEIRVNNALDIPECDRKPSPQTEQVSTS